MTDQKPAAGDGVGERGTTSNACGQPGFCQLEKRPPDKDNKHVVRIVGTYSLLTFFEEEGQRAFFEKITSPEFESTFKPDGEYPKRTQSFCFDIKEEEFELRMTNLGFIREGFWREAFPPIFKLIDINGKEQTSKWELPTCTEHKLTRAVHVTDPDKNAEAVFYQYCLEKLDEELGKVGGEREVHIGLNKFGIVNIGITVKWGRTDNQSFEDLCKDAYTKVSHLQEDPLQDCKTLRGKQDPVITTLEQRKNPRLLVSYFQVLAITTIHRFLHDKLAQGAIRGFQNECLADPWELSNKIPESTRNGLPPLRHVVFMYQLVDGFHDKAAFLKKNRPALLTLGHNVGWSPSDKLPFPAFDSRQARLKDSSLLETSCCLIFPQGLVVVIQPDRDGSGGVQTLYPGGMHDNTSSSRVTYREYWKLIFKLFIRVAEARLLIGMVNRELADIHRAFLKNRQTWWLFYPVMVVIGGVKSLIHNIRWRFLACKTGESQAQICCFQGIHSISNIHSRLMRVGSIIQRTSGRVITPEVTRYSFVRRKLADFLEIVNFEEHRGHIQSEFEKLNQWVGAIRTTFLAWSAIVVAITGVLLTVVTPMSWVQKWLNPDGANSACANQPLSKSVEGLNGKMENLKTTTTALNSEMDKLQEKIGPLAKDLEAVKRCQHHKQKAHKQ